MSQEKTSNSDDSDSNRIDVGNNDQPISQLSIDHVPLSTDPVPLTSKAKENGTGNCDDDVVPQRNGKKKTFFIKYTLSSLVNITFYFVFYSHHQHYYSTISHRRTPWEDNRTSESDVRKS